MGNLVFGRHAADSALPDASEFSSMFWAFVLIAAMSVVGFASAWLVTTALIAAPP